jgi:alginate O-acetyltransferase complex protein AlgI
MVFLSYEFISYAAVFFILYYACPFAIVRLLLVILSGCGFLYLYGGCRSLIVALVLITVSFLAPKARARPVIDLAIIICAATLIFYKYTDFLLNNVIAGLIPHFAGQIKAGAAAISPVAVPLGISFFTFEFIHYLVDVRKGRPPINKVTEFLSFGLFWPTMVAGPIKRYQDFIPALHQGLSGPTLDDLSRGLARIATGFVKKWGADNLTGWITYSEPLYLTWNHKLRWLYIAALSARIVLDFSGYSDIAIGFARMLGIKVPENFNWPYLARSPAEFWQRWHMSLSTWIRDYIYIPLGGNRLGPGRKVINGLSAMALCGLWHGPSWNFVLWGIYHGMGLAAGSLFGGRRPFLKPEQRPPDLLLKITGHLRDTLSWALTMVFVGVGWLLFFYPVDKAWIMARGLIRR